MEPGLSESVSSERVRFIPPKEGAQTFSFHAHHLAETIKPKDVAKIFRLQPSSLDPGCLAYDLGGMSYCLFFNFGTVVFFNISKEVREETLKKVKASLGLTQEGHSSDEYALERDPDSHNTVSFEKTVATEVNRETVALLARVLAQSTALDFFEEKIEAILSQMERLTGQLERRGKTDLSEKKIRQFIGMAMGVKQKLIGALALLEKPEVTWESRVLDDLYTEAVTMFELKERFRNLDYKLKTIQENLELLSNFTVNRTQIFLETAIVGLIVFEIILIVFEMF